MTVSGLRLKQELKRPGPQVLALRLADGRRNR
jgi:hypothetical protein